jgi:hypothetical protein
MKQSLTIFLFLVTSFTINAQVTSISSIRVGVSTFVGGSLIAEQNNHGAPEMEFLPTLAYNGGFIANVNWYENLGLQIEGAYTFQGQNHSGNQGGVDTDKKVMLNYVKIPIMFKYTFTNYSESQNAPNLFFLAGPQFGFLQTASVTYDRNGVLGFEEYHETVYNPIQTLHPAYTNDIDLFNNFEVSLSTGFGAEFELSDYLFLTIESRLNIGISDVNARTWRFPDLRNNYSASKNYIAGFNIGFVGIIW